jgi:tRNA nucleotidyltransferase/poly(A) polymerase
VGAEYVPDVALLLALAGGESLRPLAERILGELDQKPALSLRDLQVTGKDLMVELGMPPGPAIGQMLERLLERVLDDPTQNEKKQLLSLAQELN